MFLPLIRKIKHQSDEYFLVLQSQTVQTAITQSQSRLHLHGIHFWRADSAPPEYKGTVKKKNSET